jgi:predicted secreted protein
MGLVSGIVVFIIIWWTVIFAVLPWGVRPEVDDVKPGHQVGAPVHPRMWRKVLITTAIAVVLWVVIELLIVGNVFSFRDWAESWSLTQKY